IQTLRTSLQETMWENAGVMRTEQRLKRGIAEVAEIEAELLDTGVEGTNLAFNLTWHDWLNMRSLCDISDAIARAALARENSRGAHYRKDFPDQGELESSYFTVARKPSDKVEVTREDVRFTIVQPGESILPEGEPETLVGTA
ncbi:MAG: succinate dehydrogenase/fumarate reductase flavoprotein subunit, partial [Hyphomicrobiales bacterium]